MRHTEAKTLLSHATCHYECYINLPYFWIKPMAAGHEYNAYCIARKEALNFKYYASHIWP